MAFDSKRFARDFDWHQKIFRVIFTVATVSIVTIFIAIISFYIILGTAAVKSADAIEKDGLKAVIERVWCGQDSKCSL